MLMSVSAASICDIKLWLAAGLIPHQRHAPAPCVAAGDWGMLIIISITSVTAQTIQPGECITYAGRHWCWKHYPVFCMQVVAGVGSTTLCSGSPAVAVVW